MATHVKILAVLFLMVGLLFLAFAFFTPVLLGVVAALVGSGGDHDAAAGAVILGFAGVAVSVFFGCIAVPHLLCGWGLLRLKPWARILGIILSAIALVRPPFGTLLGIYGLVILFRKDSEALFVK
jgi:hypothetical protein